MSKIVRFQQLVEAAGKPEPHLVLVVPEKDRTLQAAVKSNRVVTVHQSSAGSKTDYGAVGFDPGPGRQFLIFPRGVGRFKARRIVGIKYDLLAGETLPRKSASPRNPSRRPKAGCDFPPLRILEKNEPAQLSKTEARRSEKTRRGKTERARLVRAKKERERVELEKKKAEKQARAESRAIAALTKVVRKALAYLEAGKRVPAVNLLRKGLKEGS